MRAKMVIHNVEKFGDSETLEMGAVCKSEGYDDEGSDENNTYARFTPAADLRITIQNPNLLGKFAVGDHYYLDFTKAD